MGKKTALQTKDEIAYYKGISSLVHYCVKYLKPIVLWFDVIIFAIAFSLICGILVLITSAGDEKYLVSQYNNGIKSFTTAHLNETSIEATINNQTLFLWPFYPPQAQVLNNTKDISSYTTFQFVYNNSDVFPTLSSPFDHSPTFDIDILAFYKNSTTNFKTNSFPLWYKNLTRLSLARAASNYHTCASIGGVVTSDYFCETMYKVSQICVQIEFDGTQWKNSENSGCNYPFMFPVVYEPWNVSDSEMSFFDVNVVVVSADDPYVLLQELTMGSNSFEQIGEAEKIRGNGLILSTTLGFVIIVITSIALFITHRYWQKTKGGQLEDSVPIGANFDNKNTILGWFSVGLFLLIVALSAGLPLQLHFHSYTPAGYVGVFLFLTCFPASFVCFAIFWKSIMKTKIISDFKKILVFVVSCICCIILIVYGFSTLIGTKESPLVMFFGGVILVAYLPMTGLHILQIKRLAVRNKRGGEQTPLLEPRMYTFSINEGYLKDHFEAKKSHLVPYFLVFVVLLPLLFILTLFLPPLWNISLEYYAPFISTYSLINMEIDTGSLPWKLKMYFDVVIYYFFIYSLLFFSILIKLLPIKKFIYKRKNIFGYNTCLGEISCIIYVLCFFVFWVWYWGFHYSRIADSKVISRIPRTLGHATNFWLCFLLYPVSRNSIWSNVFGVPFERAIKYHRWCGFLFFVFNTLHFYFWLFHWYWENTLFSHMWSLTIDSVNFTVVTMTVLYIPTNFMVVSAYEWVRRNYFEIFYYLHHFFIVLFIACLLHSWSLWYYITGPMVLWAFDRTMRYYRGMESMRLVSLKYESETIIATVEKSNKQRYHFEAGQYCFLNIPSISLLQWHPFTISSAPGPNNITFHIKQMSHNSWTHQLGILARSGKITQEVINVDGPYGQTLEDLKSSDVLILLAGGIGATPLHSIFKQFYYNAIARDPAHKMPKKIYFIWVSRNAEIFTLFAETLVKAAHYPEVFRVELFASQTVNPTVEGLEEAPGLSLKGGRPNLEKMFSEIASEATALGRSVSTFVCGTKTLEREASKMCLKYDIEFYTESFVL